MQPSSFILFAFLWSQLDPCYGVYLRPITPLLIDNKTACIAENLRETDRYVCDYQGNIICMNGWSRPDLLCNVPLCNFGDPTLSCNHGKCILPNTCACEVGWDGARCDTCIPLGGCRNGHCVNPMECRCDLGWVGPFCEEIECFGCDHGICHEPNRCICDQGWQGRNCSECITLPSCIHGRCYRHPFECVCDIGYTGFACHKPLCTEGCHSEHGYCRVPNECVCKLGWQGPLCDQCLPYPGCAGTCVNNEPWTCSTGLPGGIGGVGGGGGGGVGGAGGEPQWLEWNAWTDCTVTCGSGTKSRTRVCASFEGVIFPPTCPGDSQQRIDCNNPPCQVPNDAQWLEWSQWSECTVTCGGGTISRTRVCASFEGVIFPPTCPGDSQQRIDCNNPPCQVPNDAQWLEWSPWSDCPVTCGGGTISRTRLCGTFEGIVSPDACLGDSEQTRFCNEAPCPNDAQWSQWTEWSTCSVTCGDGFQSRTRTCQSFSGLGTCDGTNKQLQACGNPCPISGTWTPWSEWGPCSKTCGTGGRRARYRTCQGGFYGGRDCEGPDSQTEDCFEGFCLNNGVWSPWSLWSQCSVTCGRGYVSRSRTCLGNFCPGNSLQKADCVLPDCPLNGGWTEWSAWSRCSARCIGDTGEQARRRWCTNPAPGNGGAECVGLRKERRYCTGDIPKQSQDPGAPCYAING